MRRLSEILDSPAIGEKSKAAVIIDPMPSMCQASSSSRAACTHEIQKPLFSRGVEVCASPITLVSSSTPARKKFNNTVSRRKVKAITISSLNETPTRRKFKKMNCASMRSRKKAVSSNRIFGEAKLYYDLTREIKLLTLHTITTYTTKDTGETERKRISNST